MDPPWNPSRGLHSVKTHRGKRHLKASTCIRNAPSRMLILGGSQLPLVPEDLLKNPSQGHF